MFIVLRINTGGGGERGRERRREMEGIERWKEEEDENQRHERLNYRPPTFSPVSRYEIRQIEKGKF